MLTAGSFSQAEKGHHSQLVFWNYMERSQMNSFTMNFLFLKFKRCMNGEITGRMSTRRENAKNVRN
jgi:hypothetical protein